MPLTVPRFDDALSSWQRPEPFLGPLGHHVTPSAPVGVVSGLATVVTPTVTHDDGDPLTYSEPAARSGGEHGRGSGAVWSSSALPEVAPPRVLRASSSPPSIQRLRAAPAPEVFRDPLPVVGGPEPTPAGASAASTPPPAPSAGEADLAPLVGSEPAGTAAEPGPITGPVQRSEANDAPPPPPPAPEPPGLVLGPGAPERRPARRPGLGPPLPSVPGPGGQPAAIQRDADTSAPSPSSTGSTTPGTPPSVRGAPDLPLQRDAAGTDVGGPDSTGTPDLPAGEGDAGQAEPPTAPLIGQREPLDAAGEPLQPRVDDSTAPPPGSDSGELALADPGHGPSRAGAGAAPVQESPPGPAPTTGPPSGTGQSSSHAASPAIVQRQVGPPAGPAPGPSQGPVSSPSADTASAGPGEDQLSEPDVGPIAPVVGPIAPVVGDVPLIDHPAPLAINQPGQEPPSAGDGVIEAPLPLQRDVAAAQPTSVAVPADSGPVLARSLDGPRLAPEASGHPTSGLLTGRTGMVQRALRLAAPLTAIGTDTPAGEGAATGPAAPADGSGQGGPAGWTSSTGAGVEAERSGAPGLDSLQGVPVAQRQPVAGAGRAVLARWHSAPQLQGRRGDPVTAQTLRDDASHRGAGQTAGPAIQRAGASGPGVRPPVANGTSGHGAPPSPGATGSAMSSWTGAGLAGTGPSGGQSPTARSGGLPLAHPTSPTAVQRSMATLSAAPGTVSSHGSASNGNGNGNGNGHAPAPAPTPAPPTPAPVQRAVEIDELTTSAVPEGGGDDPEGESEAAEPDVHALAAKLYRPLRNRLMNELRLDRERNGLTTERRR